MDILAPLESANREMMLEYPTATPVRKALIEVTISLNEAEMLPTQIAIWGLAGQYNTLYQTASIQYLMLQIYLPAADFANVLPPLSLELPSYAFPPSDLIA